MEEWNPREIILSSDEIERRSNISSCIKQDNKIGFKYFNSAADKSIFRPKDTVMADTGWLIKEYENKVTTAQVQKDNKDIENLPSQRTYISVERFANINADNLSEGLCVVP